VGSEPTSNVSSSGGSISSGSLTDSVAAKTTAVEAKVSELQSTASGPSLADTFEMQMRTNRSAQLSEMSSSVVSKSNKTILAMARNVKD
jgi:hypothetical protein